MLTLHKFVLWTNVNVYTLHKVRADATGSSATYNDENTSSYADADPIPYIDSYGNYYANWTPELYQKYGLPQEYYPSAIQSPKKLFRRQGAYNMMTNMLGEEAGVSII